ncbi:JmjC domain-containing protein [Streptomyces sp. NPDC000134]|uniref:JmjC domain-containing protein n=1 Tax=Streptomyces sp. NPDC000134 TaxID=3364536 RepID=UPI003686018F
MSTDPARDIAYTVLTALSSAVVPHWELGVVRLAHLPAALPEQWTTSLPLPSDPGARGPDQPVTLVDDCEFQRESDETALAEAYAHRPRTRVLENVGTRCEGWQSLTALHLARVLERQVVCSLYESRPQDATMGWHWDDWDGVILQVRGAKFWRLRTEPDADPHTVVTRPGDVLLLPRGLPHDVMTPDHSVHLAFAVTQHPLGAEPLGSAPAGSVSRPKPADARLTSTS